MANVNDNSKTRMVAFRLPNDLADILEARRVPGQPFAYVLVKALRESLTMPKPFILGSDTRSPIEQDAYNDGMAMHRGEKR